MYSIRKWLYKPKRTDPSMLAQFFYADEELNMVATELDSFDGRKDPERCTALVNQLRMCQDKVLNIIENIMEEEIPDQRATRDFRVKFPDDVLQESLAGQLWFGAECLAAGSSIMNREVESASMRPLAKALTRHLDCVRSIMRDQCLRNITTFCEKIRDALVLFDRLFAEFELSYVSAMVPVKSMREFDMTQDIIVLFCETVQRALRLSLLTQDMLDDYDPALMFTIPRLSIVCGLLVYPEGPLNPDMDPANMTEMFRPFQTLLFKIRELLWTLTKEELWTLEKSLCSAEEPGVYREIQTPPFGADDKKLGPGTQDQEGDSQCPIQMDSAIFETDNDQSEPSAGLLMDQSDFFFDMTHSPSTVTVIANSDIEQSSVDINEDEINGNTPSAQHLSVDVPKHQIPHQDSNDSGMSGTLSDHGSAEHAPGVIAPGVVAPRGIDPRALRHSISWPQPHPSPSREADISRHRYSYVSDGDESVIAALGQSDQYTSRTAWGQMLGRHEFNFNLPLNTQTVTPSASDGEGLDDPSESMDIASASTAECSPMEQEPPADGILAPIPPADATQPEPALPPRIIYTNDSCESETEEGPQITFVTETLNEFFVTDTTSFQIMPPEKWDKEKVKKEINGQELVPNEGESKESSMTSDSVKDINEQIVSENELEQKTNNRTANSESVADKDSSQLRNVTPVNTTSTNPENESKKKKVPTATLR